MELNKLKSKVDDKATEEWLDGIMVSINKLRKFGNWKK